jgi:hypothetical protein
MIVAAAIIHQGMTYALPAPARHGNVIHHICKTTGATRVNAHEDDQGFIDHERGYVTREEAWKIAEASGQLLERAPTDGRDGKLYSEDVWEGIYEDDISGKMYQINKLEYDQYQILRKIFIHSHPEKFEDTFFICGEGGLEEEKDNNGLPSYIMVCPAYGADARCTKLYKRVDKDG